MTWKDKALLSGLIWVCVFPGVLLITYGLKWLGIELALWLEIMISTALTVPLISVVAAPQVERIVAATRGQTPAELKLDQAREASGPDPEEVVNP